jgi:hypothetical protein
MNVIKGGVTKLAFRRPWLRVALVVATMALIGSFADLDLRGPSTSYVDGYNFAVGFTHGLTQPRMHYSRLNADSSCSVWSFANAGGVPPGDTPREWRHGCEAALTSGAYRTITR